jgi:hypothetical protein
LELNPTIVNAYENIGVANLAGGEFEKSLEFYDRAIRLSPHIRGSDQHGADRFRGARTVDGRHESSAGGSSTRSAGHPVQNQAQADLGRALATSRCSPNGTATETGTGISRRSVVRLIVRPQPDAMPPTRAISIC